MRHHARPVLLALLVVAAGCLGGGGGGATETPSPPLRATASPATLDAATLDATGYAERRADAPALNTTVTARIVGDVTLRTTRDVRATTARRVYVRGTPDGPVVVALYAVPSVKPFENADLRKNPAAGLSPAALVTRAQSVYRSIADLSTAGERSVTVLGNATTLARYRGTATRNGTSQSVAVAVATVPHGDDYVSVVVVRPHGRDVSLDGLLGAVRHEKG